MVLGSTVNTAPSGTTILNPGFTLTDPVVKNATGNVTLQPQEGEYKIDTASFSQALNEYYKQAEKHQQKVWEREDSALTRAAADARRAGIDPNLVGLEGAGTTSTYGSALETGLNANYESLLSQMKNEFTKAFEGSENSKDRDTKLDAAMLIGIFNLLAIFMKK